MTALAAAAERLLSLHHRDTPLLLANVWDAASAHLVHAAGFPALATSSAAVAESLGFPDSDSMDVDLLFAAIGRIGAVADVPLTADLEAGYGLPADQLVRLMLDAGAVGCNLEDTDHHGDAVLVDADVHAARLSAVRAAADAAGVHVVINARTDVAVHRVGSPEEQQAEIVRRGRVYLDAGADCVYPIWMKDEATIGALVDALGAPVNVLLRPGVPALATLRRLGVARVSMGSGLFRIALAAAGRAAEAVARGEHEELWA